MSMGQGVLYPKLLRRKFTREREDSGVYYYLETPHLEKEEAVAHAIKLQKKGFKPLVYFNYPSLAWEVWVRECS